MHWSFFKAVMKSINFAVSKISIGNFRIFQFYCFRLKYCFCKSIINIKIRFSSYNICVKIRQNNCKYLNIILSYHKYLKFSIFFKRKIQKIPFFFCLFDCILFSMQYAVCSNQDRVVSLIVKKKIYVLPKTTT